MINITIYDNGFEIEGHAGYAHKGSDIICAAVSALSQTCRISITELAGYEPVCEEKDGYMKLMCADVNEVIRVLLKSFELGIEAVNKNYAGFIKIVRFVR